jgi:hypothetical protein
MIGLWRSEMKQGPKSKTCIECVARLLCEADDSNPDITLGGDGQNFLWMEYRRMAKGLAKAGLVIVPRIIVTNCERLVASHITKKG